MLYHRTGGYVSSIPTSGIRPSTAVILDVVFFFISALSATAVSSATEMRAYSAARWEGPELAISTSLTILA
jgi:hypothetical protein